MRGTATFSETAVRNCTSLKNLKDKLSKAM